MAEPDSNDDELFSMDELEKNLKRPRGGRRLLWFAAGLVLGVAGTILLPRYAAPYLPFGGGGELLTGPVLSEERDGERLLLTIEARQGAFIASFSRRVSEIALLVEPGDTVTISVGDYDPFIEDPDFEGVRKARRVGEGGDTPAGAGADPAERTMPPADSVSSPAGSVADSVAADTARVAAPGGATSSPEAAPDSAGSR